MLGAMLLFGTTSNAQEKSEVQLGKSPVADVIKAMTLEEKAKLLVGTGFHFRGMPGSNDTPEKVPGAAGNTYAIPRLGIPSIVLSDGPAGVRINPFRNGDSTKAYYATAWPVATLLASTWDTTMVHEVGKAFGQEAKEYGVDVILAPAMNIHRNPLGGRNFEYYSEDPVVSGNIGAAFVNGFESNGVGTSIKHFDANNQETDRTTVNTIVSERALREIYLKGFEIAVKKSQPWTVMSSYNYVNDTYTSENRDLLTTILRDEWGFKGLVMTDWGGGSDPVAQVNAGNDLIMPGRQQQADKIVSAVQHDSIDEQQLDTNVARMLNLILESPTFHEYKYSDKPDFKAHALVSKTAAEDGMVLLKNETVLPLKAKAKVALFGITSYDMIAGGTGSGDVHKAYMVNLDEGLSNAGFVIDNGLKSKYETYIQDEKAKQPKPRNFFTRVPRIGEMPLDDNLLSSQAKSADVAVFTLGRISGEGRDRELDGDYYLSDTEKVAISNIAKAFHAQHKKLVVVLNVGGVIEVASWRDNADAILLAYQPGQEAGNAVADLLTGKVDPSGKLATTIPMDYQDVPSAKNFPGIEFPDKAVEGPFGRKRIPAEVHYDEGIYVGYRYYKTFDVKTAYPFGYGLSYTNFTYSSPKVSAPNGSGQVTVSFNIKNTGKAAGKEVAEIYVTAPAKILDKPNLELKSFAKTSLLQPGQSQSINITLNESDLGSFDTQRSAWVTDAGTYTVKIGASADDIKLSQNFVVNKELVNKVHDVLHASKTLNELRASK